MRNGKAVTTEVYIVCVYIHALVVAECTSISITNISGARYPRSRVLALLNRQITNPVMPYTGKAA